MIDYSLHRDCIQELESLSVVYIKDTEMGQSMICDEMDWHVKVDNGKQERLYFIRIDKCIYTDNETERCDFSISTEDRIYFVEIKEIKKVSSRSKRRKKAKSQLISTINAFKNFGLRDMSRVTAVISLVPKIDEMLPTIVTTTKQNTIDVFLKECGCPNVIEGNLIKF